MGPDLASLWPLPVEKIDAIIIDTKTWYLYIKQTCLSVCHVWREWVAAGEAGKMDRKERGWGGGEGDFTDGYDGMSGWT